MVQLELDLLWIGAILMFAIEFYNAVGHFVVMTGMLLLPRKDLIRMRYYSLADMLSVTVATCLTGRFVWLAGLHMLQHLFYFVTWERSYWAKRLIDWSSLDWPKSDPEKNANRLQSQIDSFLATLFDLSVHIFMLYALATTYLDVIGVLVAALVAQWALYIVIFNPRFAWSNPNSTPAWVQRRLGKLSLQYD